MAARLTSKTACQARRGTCQNLDAARVLIPTHIDQNPCANWRSPMDTNSKPPQFATVNRNAADLGIPRVSRGQRGLVLTCSNEDVDGQPAPAMTMYNSQCL